MGIWLRVHIYPLYNISESKSYFRGFSEAGFWIVQAPQMPFKMKLIAQITHMLVSSYNLTLNSLWLNKKGYVSWNKNKYSDTAFSTNIHLFSNCDVFHTGLMQWLENLWTWGYLYNRFISNEQKVLFKNKNTKAFELDSIQEPFNLQTKNIFLFIFFEVSLPQPPPLPSPHTKWNHLHMHGRDIYIQS